MTLGHKCLHRPNTCLSHCEVLLANEIIFQHEVWQPATSFLVSGAARLREAICSAVACWTLITDNYISADCQAADTCVPVIAV